MIEYSMIHMKRIDELGEMARKCKDMKELTEVMKLTLKELD